MKSPEKTLQRVYGVFSTDFVDRDGNPSIVYPFGLATNKRKLQRHINRLHAMFQSPAYFVGEVTLKASFSNLRMFLTSQY